MIQIDKQLISDLYDKAVVNPRLRQNYDLRNSGEDKSQRMLNALMPGTEVPIHRHPISNETVICLSGKIVEVIYEEDNIAKDLVMGMDAQDIPSVTRYKVAARYMLDPSIGNFGCVVPAGAWHTVEVLEPSVIFEAKDGAFGSDGSETLDDYKQRIADAERNAHEVSGENNAHNCPKEHTSQPFSNSLGDLKKNIEYLIGMERHSGSMETLTPLYISRMLNAPLSEVEQALKEINALK